MTKCVLLLLSAVPISTANFITQSDPVRSVNTNPAVTIPKSSGPPTPARPAKKVMVWMANPFPNPARNQTVQTFIDGLKPHRMAFTGLAYQYFAICGEGSDEPGGSNDCSSLDATDPPTLSKGHPTQTPLNLGALLAAGLGPSPNGTPLELWPVISYGNPGNATVLNKLLHDDVAQTQFIFDAIAIAHTQNLTGFNFDLEAQGTNVDRAALGAFLQKLCTTLHAADPPVRVSYEGNDETFLHAPPIEGVTAMDRWISMGTYTGNTASYLAQLAQGVKSSGSKFGVGLCPICQTLDEAETQTRFAALEHYNDTVREIDLWAADYKVPVSPQWEFYWPRLQRWLRTP